MSIYNSKMLLPLRYAIVTYRLLFDCTFDAIERKTSVKAKIAQVIMRKAIKRARNNDFLKILACVENLNRTK